MAGLSAVVVLAIPLVICLGRGSSNHEINTNSGLMRMFGLAALLASVYTLPMARRFGIATAFGALGGFACGSAYWFLHLQQTIVKAFAETGQPTEYLDSTMFIVPIAWFGLGAIVSLVPLYKNKRLNSLDS